MTTHELAGLLPAEPEALVLYLGDDPNKSFALKGPPWDGGLNARHTSYDFSAGAIPSRQWAGPLPVVVRAQPRMEATDSGRRCGVEEDG